MSMYMETTKISAERTAQEISGCLIQSGASAIRQDLKEKRIVGLSFTLEVNGESVPFSLPVRVEPVFVRLQKKLSPRNRAKNAQSQLQQAERVAWRQLLRWIQAQVALIDTGMVDPQEVFMPYIQTGANQTLYEKLASGQLGRLQLQERT